MFRRTVFISFAYGILGTVTTAVASAASVKPNIIGIGLAANEGNTQNSVDNEPIKAITAEKSRPGAEWYLDPEDPQDGYSDPYEILYDSRSRNHVIEIHGAAVVEKSYWAYIRTAEEPEEGQWVEFSTPEAAEQARQKDKDQGPYLD